MENKRGSGKSGGHSLTVQYCAMNVASEMLTLDNMPCNKRSLIREYLEMTIKENFSS